LRARNLEGVPRLRARARPPVVIPIVAGALVVGLLAVNLRLFVFPASSTPEHADAVVVLAGGEGERLDKAFELARDGVAPNLVVSNGPDRLCGGRYTFVVHCFVPNPGDTRGEAEAIGRLATKHGWHHVVLVTSEYHVTRARLLLGRCFPGTIDVSAARSGLGPVAMLRVIVHEWGGLAAAALHEDC